MAGNNTISRAILANLRGTTGANGETLSLLRYFPMQEAAAAMVLVDASGNAANGAAIGAPTTAAAGPAENDDTTKRGHAFDGSTMGWDLGVSGNVLAQITNTLTVGVFAKNAQRGTRVWDILNSFNAGQTVGFRIGFVQRGDPFGANADQLGAYVRNGANYAGLEVFRPDVFADNEWHLLTFVLTQAAVKIGLDGFNQAGGTVRASGTVGTFGSGTGKMMIGALSNGTSAADLSSALQASLAHMFIVAGEPTQRQLRNILRGAWHTVRGIPGFISYSKGDRASAYADAALTTKATTSQEILGLADLSGHGSTWTCAAGNGPTLEYAKNAQTWGAMFDNFFARYDVWKSGGTGGTDGRYLTQQAMGCTLGVKVSQRHVGTIAMFRPLASLNRDKASRQTIIGLFDSNGTPREVGGLFISHATDAVSSMQNGADVETSGLKKHRAFPGLCVSGVSVAFTGNFNGAVNGAGGSTGAFAGHNRWRAYFATEWGTSGAWWNEGDRAVTAVLGGTIGLSGTGGADTCAMTFDEGGVTRCPYTEEEYDAFVARAFEDKGEQLYPKKHVVKVGDSIPSGNASRKLQTMFTTNLRASARTSTSWCNTSRSSDGLHDHLGDPQYGADSRGTNSVLFWDEAAEENWVLGEINVNDAAIDAATFDSQLGVLLGYLHSAVTIAGVVWTLCADNNSSAAAFNVKLEARKAAGDITELIPLTALTPLGMYYQGPHPTPAGAVVWAKDCNPTMARYFYDDGAAASGGTTNQRSTGMRSNGGREQERVGVVSAAAVADRPTSYVALGAATATKDAITATVEALGDGSVVYIDMSQVGTSRPSGLELGMQADDGIQAGDTAEAVVCGVRLAGSTLVVEELGTATFTFDDTTPDVVNGANPLSNDALSSASSATLSITDKMRQIGLMDDTAAASAGASAKPATVRVPAPGRYIGLAVFTQAAGSAGTFLVYQRLFEE